MSTHASIEDKTAIVTGASDGIGAVTAWELARAGARVVLAVRNPAKTQAAIATWKGRLEIRSLRPRRPRVSARLRPRLARRHRPPHQHYGIVVDRDAVNDAWPLAAAIDHAHAQLLGLTGERDAV